jgi:hypothetical protein
MIEMEDQEVPLTLVKTVVFPILDLAQTLFRGSS